MPLIDGAAARQVRRRLKRSVEQIAGAVTDALDDDGMEPKTLFNIESGGGRVGCSWERAYALAEALGLEDPRPILVKDDDKKQCTPAGSSPNQPGSTTPREQARPTPSGPGRQRQTSVGASS